MALNNPYENDGCACTVSEIQKLNHACAALLPLVTSQMQTNSNYLVCVVLFFTYFSRTQTQPTITKQIKNPIKIETQ